MPSNLLAIDSDFPTFVEDEPVDRQIQSLVNYLYQLRESLQYSLQNLSKENFNAAALDNLTKEASQEIAAELQRIQNVLTNFSSEISRINGDVKILGESIEELYGYAIESIEIVEIS